MVKYYRFFDIPATHLFLIAGGIINFKTVIKLKIGKIEKGIYIVFTIFILIAFFDLLRSKLLFDPYLFEFRLILLLISLRLYSYFICRYGIDYFIKCLAISSAFVLLVLLYNSLIVFNAPFLVVDLEIITEAGKNQLAFYLALVTPMVFWFSRKQNLPLSWKILIYISLSILIFSAIYVQSKGLLLSIIVSSIITTLFYTKLKLKLKFKNFIKIGFILVIPAYILMSQEFVDLDSFKAEINSLLSQNIQDSNSSAERLSLLNKSFHHFSKNPITGIGTNNFASIEEKATHNNYLQILAENGLLGFLIFIGFIVFLHNRLWNMKMNSVNYYLVINSLWSLTIYLFVINGFFNAATMIILAIVIYFEKSYKYSSRILADEG